MKPEDIVQTTHDAIKALIQVNEARRNAAKETFRLAELDPIHYAMVLQTVTVEPGRQMGKSNFIGKYAEEYEAVVIVPNEMIHSSLAANYPHLNIFQVTHLDLQSVTTWIREERPRRVFIEDPLVMSDNDVRRIYDIFSNLDSERELTYVFFGHRLRRFCLDQCQTE